MKSDSWSYMGVRRDWTEKWVPSVINNVGHTQFSCFLWQTFVGWENYCYIYLSVSISISAWKICKIWWKVIAGHIWWWDDFEWQKCVPSVINNVVHTPKNATVKNFTSKDFLGPIRFDYIHFIQMTRRPNGLFWPLNDLKFKPRSDLSVCDLLKGV